MAGNYPDAPSNRMLLDRDGAQLYKIDSANAITQLTSGQVQIVVDEASAGYQLHGQNQTATLLVYFPERRDLAAYLWHTQGGTLAVSVSVNSTNGVDGTWTALTSSPFSGALSPGFRSNLQTVTALGIRAIKFLSAVGAPSSGVFPTVHLYGNPSAGQNPNRLAIWHPTSDAHVAGAFFDWGDTPRSSSADKTFRVKNMSATLTAENITVAFDALTDTTPSVPGQFLVSEDGTTFGATADIGNLAPGGISPVLTVRRNTPTNATLSVWEPRLIAAAGSWA